MTDIVGSTRIAERVGDRAWSELLVAHERATRDAVALFGGEEIATTGDGFLVAFDTSGAGDPLRARADRPPGRARAAIRAGVHTGEVEHVDGRGAGSP